MRTLTLLGYFPGLLRGLLPIFAPKIVSKTVVLLIATGVFAVDFDPVSRITFIGTAAADDGDDGGDDGGGSSGSGGGSSGGGGASGASGGEGDGGLPGNMGTDGRFFTSGQPNNTQPDIARSNIVRPDIIQMALKPVSQILSDDIAVIIGNSDYQKQGKDIPDIVPAYADANAVKEWLIRVKGVREGNIIFLKDATGSQLINVFGNDRSHRGQLYNWIKPQSSNVYIYYAGHGAPAGDYGSAFLVPADSSSATLELTGYPLATLFKNLNKLPAKSITVILESCFSGTSHNGNLVNRAAGIQVLPKMMTSPGKVTVISAGRADQIASWEPDDSQSLFTKYFLKGMDGEADERPYGDGDGEVSYEELGKYLDGTMTYYARRYFGRNQNAQIVTTIK
jgi:hypothetical protein